MTARSETGRAWVPGARLHLRGARFEVLAAAVVAVTALTAAVYRVPALIRGDRAALATPSVSLADSDIDGVRYFVSAPYLQAAAAAIPPGATYTVRVGRDPPYPGVEAQGVRPAFELWLLPRVYTPSLADADWLISIHEPSGAMHVRARRSISLGETDRLIELR